MQPPHRHRISSPTQFLADAHACNLEKESDAGNKPCWAGSEPVFFSLMHRRPLISI
ncbi:hypothetical protein BU26DRAFT_513157 [Trematosphaeria pertusa]|uniref:Uncharacterized protein n=1 Tax=Trematosphaeria pertusa TaxID=390896 RepID=A0A6A6J0U3_9PLEO|nr:uncharacterized protein BU26DRAFT_513157 [Trematosphaeria pertusa]KAF2256319.1 hypothetical protein BU26DRAFT_513157 [Trematosphaeria pertusa]